MTILIFLGFGIFKTIALHFTLLSEAEPTARTKQQLPPFFYIYTNLYISGTEEQA